MLNACGGVRWNGFYAAWLVAAIVLLACIAALYAICREARNRSAPDQSGQKEAMQKQGSPISAAENELDAEVKNFRMDDLAANLCGMPAGPETNYFAGILANAEGRFTESIRLLNSALPSLRASRPDRAGYALGYLGDDYNEIFEYADSATAYDDMLSHYSNQYKPEDLQATKDNAGVADILRAAPAQTVTRHGPVKLKTERNPLGSLNVELTANGVRGPWLIDSGANVSVVSKSYAERLGLKLLSGEAQTQGSTGFENSLHIAILPSLQMGGATLYNVVLLVMDDASTNIAWPGHQYQINAVVGYPVLRALGTVTFLRTGEFEAEQDAQQNEAGARMYIWGASLAVMCNVEGKDLPFTLDTGATETDLFTDYYNRFQNEVRTWKKGRGENAGAGGMVKRVVYIQPVLNLGIGDRTARLRHLAMPASGAGSNGIYGNLGQDLMAGFDGATIDFIDMRFRLGEPVALGKTR
jgi:predicted aspartyl protease